MRIISEFIVCILVFLAGGLVRADGTQTPAPADDPRATIAHCERDERTHPSARQYVDLFLQDETMLATAFLRGWMWLEPDQEDFAMCVICAVNRPRDLRWEANLARCP